MQKKFKNILEVYAEEIANDDIRIREVPVSMVLTIPGDIISFDYHDEQRRYSHRLCLVVSTRYAPSGRKVSPRGNRLVCMYDLSDLDHFDLQMVIDLCYKKRRRCVYNRTPRALNAIMGGDRFRTFMISRMINLSKLGIEKKTFLSKIFNKVTGR